MPERKAGDWDCPECGAVVFASKETCFRCEKKAEGGGKGGKARRPGDWDCPDCGAHNFANKETCFVCDKAEGKGKARRPGDWDCPDCGAVNFASRETCFACEKASKGLVGGRREGDWDCPECGAHCFASKTSCFKCGAIPPFSNTGAKSSSSAATAADPATFIKGLAKANSKFKAAWVAYCRAYGQGFSDPAKYEDEYITEFVEHVASLIETDLKNWDASAAEPAAEEPAAEEPVKAAEPPKRKAAGAPPAEAPAKKAAKTEAAKTAPAKTAPAKTEAAAAAAAPQASAPAEKKKVTIKKAVIDEIRRLNEAGGLLQPIRPGAVATALSPLDEVTAMAVFALLEEKQGEVEDPNQFIRTEAALLVDAAEES